MPATTQRYVICYDIADDRRRDRMADTLKNYGQRVQFSVFVADLDDGLAARMREHASRLIDADDRLHIFALCGECSARTVAQGAGSLPRDERFYVL